MSQILHALKTFDFVLTLAIFLIKFGEIICQLGTTMTSDCIYPQIEERLTPVHEDQDYESDYSAESYDFNYQKWASKQNFMSLFRSLSDLDLSSAQHIEDIHDISEDDLKPIVNLDRFNDSDDATESIAEFLVSMSPSPPEYPIHHTSWGNADEIPTRVPSASLEDFPPLVRCRDMPAMGYTYDYIMDLDESVLPDWSFSCLLKGGYDERDKDVSDDFGESPDSSLFSCKEGAVRVSKIKDDQSWAFIPPENNSIPLQSPCTDTLHYYEAGLPGTYD